MSAAMPVQRGLARASSNGSADTYASNQNSRSSKGDGRAQRSSKRISVTALYMSMNANQKDVELEDDLARAQKQLGDLKAQISAQSKKNFVLDKDVRYLDSRIALLIQNRIALEEQKEVTETLEMPTELTEGSFPNDVKTQRYGNLFFLLQSEPRHIAHLCRLVTLSEIEQLLQTVMFTIYGNQYESREEHLLLTMFQSVLTYQFDNTPDYSSLLRANTPVSRMMTTYTRRGPGQSYLQKVLSERINAICSVKDLDCEINSLKVYEHMVKQLEKAGSGDTLPKGISAEQAMQNVEVQNVIAPRVQTLRDLANEFLDTIIAGLEEVPYGIRWICKQIRSLSRRKYPDAEDQTICTLIGGFFFLRFINPAIVTPQSYMLISSDASIGDSSKRTLTYIAKMIQNLANKPSYAKEPYMAAMQPWIEENKQRINQFMLDLCEVQDFYENLEMDNYVALSKKDLELSISINEIYAMHALFEKHQTELTRDGRGHLSQLLSELGKAPSQLPRKDNRAISLPLFSRWETAIDDLTAALDITEEDIYFMEAKSTFVMIMRTLPTNSVVRQRPLRLNRVAEAAATTKNDSVMVRKGIRAMELLNQLEEMGVVERWDNYAALCDEVDQELQYLGSLKENVEVEIVKLEEVYSTILEHNNYLVSKLNTYKQYLQNVRSRSDGSEKKQKTRPPVKVSLYEAQKQGMLVRHMIPDHHNKKGAVYFVIASTSPGTFVISMWYKGRETERSIFELDLKLDDLLEMRDRGNLELDLDYITMDVVKLLKLLSDKFEKGKKK